MPKEQTADTAQDNQLKNAASHRQLAGSATIIIPVVVLMICTLFSFTLDRYSALLKEFLGILENNIFGLFKGTEAFPTRAYGSSGLECKAARGSALCSGRFLPIAPQNIRAKYRFYQPGLKQSGLITVLLHVRLVHIFGVVNKVNHIEDKFLPERLIIIRFFGP